MWIKYMVDRFDAYYRTSSGSVNVGGYAWFSTNGTIGGGTRYYDDTLIVGIDLVLQFNNNQTYSTKVKQIVGMKLG